MVLASRFSRIALFLRSGSDFVGNTFPSRVATHRATVASIASLLILAVRLHECGSIFLASLRTYLHRR